MKASIAGGLALALLGAACSSGGSNDFEPPTCGAGELALEGSVDGEPVSVRVVGDGSVWSNFPDEGNNPYAEVFGPEVGAPLFHIEWDRALGRDTTTVAFGSVDLPSQSLKVGNCGDDGFVSLITAREDGADFLLRDLHEGTPCEGQAVNGELAGCFRFRANP